MLEQKLLKRMFGYKATDKDMRCRDHQFVLGKWAEVAGELELCGNGFHFCEYPSGPWNFYQNPGTRMFRVEAEDVLDSAESAGETGASKKWVCRRIRLFEEITDFDRKCNQGTDNTGTFNVGGGNIGDCNTGELNTSDFNVGHRNTGDQNTGDQNTGYRNVGRFNTGTDNRGSSNSGNCNSGSLNTGYFNVGDNNSGAYNTGNANTGSNNVGDINSGFYNAGDGNTGYGNATDYDTGFFCANPATVRCFDVDTGLSRAAFIAKYPAFTSLGSELAHGRRALACDYPELPGITQAKLDVLYQRFIDAKAAKAKSLQP